VQAARRRLLEAGDVERRRLERDLHDGAQQRLVGLGLLLRMTRARAEAGDAGVGSLLEEAEDGLRWALEDLRTLARGIHPAALSEGGLGPALRVLAARAPFPVAVECPGARLPEAVETAVWFVVSEALTNVAKHADASRAAVRVTIDGGRARVEVADDGRGGAVAGRGSGLGGLMERAAALGGVLTVADDPGGGTLLVAELPCA
jgi:signal transduction histidine kinase